MFAFDEMHLSRPPLLVPSPSGSTLPVERNRHSRKVTRDIAALDFLQNIPMRSECVAADPLTPSEVKTEMSTMNGTKAVTPVSDSEGSGGLEREPLAGRRLPGMATTIVRVPSMFRYRFTTKFPAASAVVRRWEGVTIEQGLLDSRLFFSQGCGYPLATTIIINYNDNETAARRRRIASMSSILALERSPPTYYDWRGTSYFRLLHATWSACDPDRDQEDAHPEQVPFSANFLDDPEFRQGRHRHVVRGDKSLGPIVSSILLFVKPHELKDELNQKFQEKHGWWLQDPSLSLSKLRHLKRQALMCSQRLGLEVATVALACVLFEKLVLQHYITKVNRKLYMAVCFLLAVKFNEPCTSVERKRVVRQLLEDIDRVHGIPARDILKAEFTVYAQLSFNLHVPIAEVHPHFARLLKLVESNPRKYLDDDVFTSYSALLAIEEQAENSSIILSDPLDRFDEITIGEVRLSHDDDGIIKDNDQRGNSKKSTGGGSKNAYSESVFPWQNVSFSQWWRRHRSPRERQEPPHTSTP
ncbi:Cyclin ik3-1/CABLES [Plasmopara halstedii]|uniref:Cyclin ik3-1/CABLES n=1 Tax=Plasmopara halstedii TaxID=4781 RepID=A0A0P1APJ4_PLAHL|nr:Cyclin ik3-1/CABLES [Plasmopara halstedii]CEG43394.1 Cyclin ik3-1/CABLES [Plasmopara halstedii]|eukprot:XP_024579763.1 Cyclin ik3-1/CABLES [Plasmopara halstedii]